MHASPRQLKTQECPAGTGTWYVCAVNKFTGCCPVDPCSSNGGCPSHVVITPSSQVSFLPVKTTSTVIEAITSSNGGRTVYITVTEVSIHTPTSQPTDVLETQSLPPGLDRRASTAGPIAGGVVGGVVILGLILFLLFLWRRRRQLRERLEATLPAHDVRSDMSLQLCHSSGCAIGASDEKADSKEAGSHNRGALQQLDSSKARPVSELGGEILGAIPELPAFDPSPRPSHSYSNLQGQEQKDKTKGGHDHVLSWAHFSPTDETAAAARLSQPHNAPDTTVGVWGNLSKIK